MPRPRNGTPSKPRRTSAASEAPKKPRTRRAAAKAKAPATPPPSPEPRAALALRPGTPALPASPQASRAPRTQGGGMPPEPHEGGLRTPPASSPVLLATEGAEGPQYLYGVVRAVGELDFGLIGLGVPPADVRAVREGDLAALVSTAPGPVVDPTRSHLLVHQRVTEAVLREHTLLPVAFGTVLDSEAQVRGFLRTAHDAFSQALAALEGKVELGLKVVHHREHLARRLELEDEGLCRRADEAEAEHERRLGTAVDERVQQDMQTLLDGLGPLAAASRTWAPVGERMLLNAAFLVRRDAVAAFEAKVRSLAAHSDTYTFRFTGPWAPYSFVDVRLGLEAGEEPAPQSSLP